MNKKLILLALAIFICSISACSASDVDNLEVSDDEPIDSLIATTVEDNFNRQEHIDNPNSMYLPGFDGYYYGDTNKLYLSTGEVISIEENAVVNEDYEIVCPDGSVYSRFSSTEDGIEMNNDVTLSLPLNGISLKDAVINQLLFAKLGDSYYKLVPPKTYEPTHEPTYEPSYSVDGNASLVKGEISLSESEISIIGIEAPSFPDDLSDADNVSLKNELSVEKEQSKNIANAQMGDEKSSSVNGVDTNASGDVSMQSTGIPVAILIVALMLSVIGFRRKD